MRAYFVAGTDTNVGKTTVSAALLSAATLRGLRTGCMKPAESGCLLSEDGELVPQDAVQLLRASNLGQSLEEVCAFRLRAPLAPGVAAQQEGIQICLEQIGLLFAALVRRRPDFVLVEGAGGMLVPLSPGKLVIDIASHLQLPVLIVGRPGLGTINHTLLSIEAAKSRQLRVAGFLFSNPEEGSFADIVASNAEQIRLYSGVPYLGCLPKVMSWSPAYLAEAAGNYLALDSLL